MSVKNLLIRKATEDGRYSVAFFLKLHFKILFCFWYHIKQGFANVKTSKIPDLPSLFT